MLEEEKIEKLKKIFKQSLNECDKSNNPDEIIHNTLLELLSFYPTFEPKPIDAILNAISEDIEKTKGIFTGFEKLDNYISGFLPGELIVIASRPAIGKSTFILNIIENIMQHFDKKTPVLLFSPELKKEQIIFRLLALKSGIENFKFRNPQQLLNSEKAKISQVSQEIEKYPLFIDDTPGISINEILIKTIEYVKKHKVKIVFIDFFQLIYAPITLKYRRMDFISFSLKKLAKFCNIPIVVLSQVSQTKKIAESVSNLELRDSGALRYDADIIIFLYQDEENISEIESFSGVPIEVEIAKNRNGQTGKFTLIFVREFMKFEDPESKNTLSSNKEVC